MEGEYATLVDELHRDQPWVSPAETMRRWSSRRDLTGPDARPVATGREPRDDVRGRQECADLGIATIWRRTSFIEQ